MAEARSFSAQFGNLSETSIFPPLTLQVLGTKSINTGKADL